MCRALTLDWATAGIPGSRTLPELRRSARWPSEGNWRTFAPQVSAWFEDNFGLRDRLLAVRARLLVHGLRVRPTDRVVLGRDAWVFMTEVCTLEGHRGVDPLTPAHLDLWRRALESRRDACARVRARYVFALAPEKSSIYPDRLPPEFEPVGPSRLDQLAEHMRQHSTVAFVDLREPLRRERARDAGLDLAHHPFGSHWTDRGAQAGMRALVDRIAGLVPGLNRPGDVAEQWHHAGRSFDDWSSRLYLDWLGPTANLVAHHAPHAGARLVHREGESDQVQEYVSDALDAPALLCAHDSFGLAARKFLAGCFSRAVFLWDSELRPSHLEAARPDVVVELFVERVLAVTPHLWPIAVPGELEQRFASAGSTAYAFGPRDGSAAPIVEGARRHESGTAGLRVVAAEAPPLLRLPPFSIPPDRMPLLRLELEADREGMVLVLFTTERDPELSRRNSYSYRLRPGLNTVLAELAAPGIEGSILLALPGLDAVTTVRYVEARLVPR